MDWFKPYLRTEYSVGVIYLTIQNLPQSEQFKENNVILVEFSLDLLNPAWQWTFYLGPLVEELKEGWTSAFSILTSEKATVKICVALRCVECDITACRKVLGFLGHHAYLACNKCLKRFPVTFGCPSDYSVFDKNWVVRTNAAHRQQCKEILEQTTKSATRKLETTYGLQFSVLVSLP